MVTLVVSQAATVLYYVVVTRPQYVQPSRQLALERVPCDYPRDTKPETLVQE